MSSRNFAEQNIRDLKNALPHMFLLEITGQARDDNFESCNLKKRREGIASIILSYDLRVRHVCDPVFVKSVAEGVASAVF